MDNQGFPFLGGGTVVAVSLSALPRFLVLDPVSTVRLEVRLARPTCEIDVELENPRPGRSFLLLIGPQGGPLVRRMRLSGRARILFEPRDDRTHVLMLANPQKEPLVLRFRGRAVRRSRTTRRTRPSRRGRPALPGRHGSRPSPSRVPPRVSVAAGRHVHAAPRLGRPAPKD